MQHYRYWNPMLPAILKPLLTSNATASYASPVRRSHANAAPDATLRTINTLASNAVANAAAKIHSSETHTSYQTAFIPVNSCASAPGTLYEAKSIIMQP